MMKPNEDFCDYPVKKWQELIKLSRRIETLNSLIDVFGSDDIRVQPLADDCQEIVDILIDDFESTLNSLIRLIEIEDEIL